MNWFKKTSPQHSRVISAIDNVNARVEIETSADAKQEAVEQAREASRQLNELLVENGFTLKIYVATGGRPPRKHE